MRNGPDAPRPAKRSVGRPRSPEIEQRLKTASLQVLAELGFGGLTIERICERAGVPRATFYRRWPSPAALVSAAFNERFETGMLEARGSLHDDLLAFALKLVALYNDPLLGPCLMFILPEARLKPELTATMAEAERMRRQRNVEALTHALETQGYAPGMSPRMILNVLNSVANSTYISNRRVTAEDFRALIGKLLLDAPPSAATPV